MNGLCEIYIKSFCINFDQCNKTTAWSLCWHPNQFPFDSSGLSHSMNKTQPTGACGLFCCCWSVIMCIVRGHCPCACLSKIFSCSRQWLPNSTTRHPSWAGQVHWTHVGSRKFCNNLVKMQPRLNLILGPKTHWFRSARQKQFPPPLNPPRVCLAKQLRVQLCF